MRTTLFISGLLLLISSCQNEEPVKPVVVPTWDDLHLTWSRVLLPDAYYTNITKAVFVDDLGVERKLDLQIDTASQQVTKDTFEYTEQKIEVAYSDPNVLEFYMEVTAQNEYSPSGLKNFEAFFTAMFAPKLENFTPLITLQGPNDIRVGILQSSKTIAGLNFENVYAFIPEVASDHSYDELYYVGGFGIVGFQGQDGEMWGLKGYE